MKNTVVYYLVILLPILLIIWVATIESSTWFVYLILIYALPYRILTDGARLVSKDAMKWNDVWKLLFPGSRFRYFKVLYFS
ncbi:MAG: hypothetical protein PF541_13725 [Prolixibacteraceae bacterium]|jgi:hypothetical protein|nr:hypothetical protein [Prolixibacteraceae bacterium]